MRIRLITHPCFGCCWVVFTPSHRILSFPCSANENAGVPQGFVRGHRQNSCPKMAKGIFHARGIMLSASGLGWPGAAAQGLAGDWWATASCPLYILIIIIVTVILIIIFFLICPIKLFSSQPVGFLTFLILSPPSHCCWGIEGVAVWCWVASWV